MSEEQTKDEMVAEIDRVIDELDGAQDFEDTVQLATGPILRADERALETDRLKSWLSQLKSMLAGDGPTYDELAEELGRVTHLLRVHSDMPVVECPSCGAPAVDYDGFGCVVCPRDPECYCTHPAIDDGVCRTCGEKRYDVPEVVIEEVDREEQ